MTRAPRLAKTIAAAIPTTHKATQELGEGVIDHRLIWTSASGLTKIDHDSFGGCARKWWFEHVAGFRQAETDAMRRGTKLHAEVEGYLTKGAALISPLAIAGRHYIPEPGPGIMIEAPLATKDAAGIMRGWINVGGILVAGHVDLWNHRGIWIDNEGELRTEPRPNTLETKDWKTTSDFQYAKSAAELAKNVQLVTYAEAGFRAWPHLEHARMTHVYFRTRNAPASKLVTVLCDREQIARRWEYAEGLVRLATDVARETDQAKVPTNRGACGAYNGCPHIKRCSVGSHNSLAEVFGERGAERVLARMRGDNPDHALQGPSSTPSLLVAPSTQAKPEPAALGSAIGASGLQFAGLPSSLLRGEQVHDPRTSESQAPGRAESTSALSAQGNHDRSVPVNVATAAGLLSVVSGGVLGDLRGVHRSQPSDRASPLVAVQPVQSDSGARSREPGDARPSVGVLGKESQVSLIDKMNPQAVAAAQAGVAVQSIAPMTPPVGVGVTVQMAPAIDAETERLKAEEAAKRAQAAAGIPNGFAESLNALLAAGYGTPQFVGRAANAVGQHMANAGRPIPGWAPGQGINGSGWLADRVKEAVEDPALVLQLAAEIASLPAVQQQAPAPAPAPAPVQAPAPVVVAPQPAPVPAPVIMPSASPLPPDAPASNPALAAAPVDGFSNAKAIELNMLQNPAPAIPGLMQTAAAVQVTGTLPNPAAAAAVPPPTTSLLAQQTTTMPAVAPAPIVTPAPAPAPTTSLLTGAPPTTATPAPVPVSTGAPAATETPATPTRTRKAGPGRGNRKKTTTTTEAVGDVSRTVSTTVEDADPAVNVFVNTLPSWEFDRFEPYIDQLCAALCAEYGAADIRCAPTDGPLGYTKWKGALAALAKQNPPPAGTYLVKYTSPDDPAYVVVDALRTHIDQTGGLLAEGVRW